MGIVIAAEDYLHSLGCEFNSIETFPMVGHDGEVVGYHAIVSRNDGASGGGTHQDKQIAIRIAVAESLERFYVHKLYHDVDLKNRFGLDFNPSTSGFAFGFDQQKTKWRAICEGLERWAWSKWIDDGHRVPECVQPEISKLGLSLASEFKEFKYFKYDFEFLTEQGSLQFSFIVSLGLTSDGVFPGSRVVLADDICWDHPIVESYRNLQVSLGFKSGTSKPDSKIEDRILHFSQNRPKALAKISSCQRGGWPHPKVQLLRGLPIEDANGYLYRCLCQDFIPWHEGPKDRFVY